MSGFIIAAVPAGGGRLALCPMPGRDGDYAGDLGAILNWAPALVMTMATGPELATHGALRLSADLAARGIGWRHLPVTDFGADSAALREGWAEASAGARAHLASGRGVLAHCLGGCGRSGMAVLRLMVEAGEAPGTALARLRAARPCAVETAAQEAWAARATGSWRSVL
ncbi:protein-tyrosine phosphatase family protein [Defluviimonas sp. SAOS-178_SWC]|uniref:protein-tyrosine phosphatase family protein n=1 Tax=Defluviimonas sp. SAOS-178_SWC TaxID=3121287 RepID=UPI003221E0FF